MFLVFFKGLTKAKERRNLFGFLQTKRTKKDRQKLQKDKSEPMEDTMKGRRARTPPSLGFWPKLGSSTVVPRSLLLPGSNGASMGRRGSRGHTPTSWNSPMRKRKVPTPIQRKTLPPRG